MPKYTVRATVTASVAIEIEAESREAARELFESNIMVTAGLADGEFDTLDDAITEMDIDSVDLSA